MDVTEAELAAAAALPDEAAEQELRRLVLPVKRTGRPELLIELQSRLARVQARLGSYEKAHETLNEIEFLVIGLNARTGLSPQEVDQGRFQAIVARAYVFSVCGWSDSARSLLESLPADLEPGWAQQVAELEAMLGG